MAAMPSPRDLESNDRTPDVLDDLAYGPNKEKIITAIDGAVRKTMETDKAKATDFEYRLRARKAWAIAQAMRYELSWGIVKICDKLHDYLRSDLDGSPLDPQAEQNDRSYFAEGVL